MGFPGGLRMQGQALSGRRRVRASQPQAQERLEFPGAGEEGGGFQCWDSLLSGGLKM